MKRIFENNREAYSTEEKIAVLVGTVFCFILILVLLVCALLICNMRLREELRQYQNSEKEAVSEETVTQAQRGDDGTLSDWQVLLLGVAMTESEFYPSARGADEDWGVFQITPIYVAEANRVSEGAQWTHEDAWSVERSLDIVEAVQGYHNPSRDIGEAIRIQNKNPYYGRKVNDRMAFVRRYEQVRAAVVDYYKQ